MRGLARWLSRPLRGYFNRRFNELNDRIQRLEWSQTALVESHNRTIDELRELNLALLDALVAVGGTVASVDSRLREPTDRGRAASADDAAA